MVQPASFLLVLFGDLPEAEEKQHFCPSSSSLHISRTLTRFLSWSSQRNWSVPPPRFARLFVTALITLYSNFCVYLAHLLNHILFRVNEHILFIFINSVRHKKEVFNYARVQFSCSVVSDSLRPHESQHARPPCPSPSPGVHSDSRPLSPWCHPAISSSVVPSSSFPQSLPASESFPMSQLFAWGVQSTGTSALAPFLPKKSQGWSPCSPRDSQESSPTPQFKSINSLVLSLLHSPTLTSIHDHWKNDI